MINSKGNAARTRKDNPYLFDTGFRFGRAFVDKEMMKFTLAANLRLCFARFQFIVGITALVCLCSCLETGTGTNADPTSASPPNPPVSFPGVSTVSNIDATSILITWSNWPDNKAINFRIFEVNASGGLTQVADQPLIATSYTHTGLAPGTRHSYVVRVVYNDGTDDGNGIAKSAITFGGVSSVTATGLNTATIQFSPLGNLASGFHIYSTAHGVTTMIGSASSTASSFQASTLPAGTTCTISVKAYFDDGSEDSNQKTLTALTTSRTYATFRGVSAVGTGAYSITYNTFTNQPATLFLRGYRVARGQAFDLTSKVGCSPGYLGTCRTGAVTSAYAPFINDADFGKQEYDYVIVFTDGVNDEELPANHIDAMRVSVPIFPSSGMMTFIYRDIVNYNQCVLMGKTPDVYNHSRCPYTGLGGTSYSSGQVKSGVPSSPLNLPSGYFDIGYSFFIDTYEAGCNWSPANSAIGKCGAGATTGDCYGDGAPAANIGIPGNVYYQVSNGKCLIKLADNVTWLEANQIKTLGAPLTSYQAVYTNSTAGTPAGLGFRSAGIPPLINVDQATANAFCQSKVDTNYGQKRLMRLKEFRVAADWGNLSRTNSNIPYSYAEYSYCFTYLSKWGGGGPTISQYVAFDSNGGPRLSMLGSSNNSNCYSTFGVVDLVGNAAEWTSERLDCNAGTNVCQGDTNPFDSGDTDFANVHFDGVSGPGGSAITNFVVDTLSYFSSALGLPLIGNDAGNALTINSNLQLILAKDLFVLNNNSGLVTRGVIVGGNANNATWMLGDNAGRWATDASNAPTFTDPYVGFRCVLPAY